MAIRALGALATAVILSTASSSWGQDAPGATDGATGSDATLGEDGSADQGTAPGDDDGGADDGGDASSGGADDSGSAINPGILDDAAFPSAPGIPSVPEIPSSPSLPSSPAGVPTVPPSPPDPGDASDQGYVQQGTDDEPPTVDDASFVEAGTEVSASWGDAAPAAEQVLGQYPPVDGCGGCSTGDTGKSGPLVFILAALVAAWRCRRRASTVQAGRGRERRARA